MQPARNSAVTHKATVGRPRRRVRRQYPKVAVPMHARLGLGGLNNVEMFRGVWLNSGPSPPTCRRRSIRGDSSAYTVAGRPPLRGQLGRSERRGSRATSLTNHGTTVGGPPTSGSSRTRRSSSSPIDRRRRAGVKSPPRTTPPPS